LEETRFQFPPTVKKLDRAKEIIMRISVSRVVLKLFLAVCLIETVRAAAPIKLNVPFGPGQNVTTASVQISPDSSRVLYLADQDADNVFEIFSVPIGGGTHVQLNGTLATGGDVLINGLDISPDGSRVVYYADQTTDEVFEVFSVPLSGGIATKLNGTLPVSGDVSNAGLQFNSSGSLVLYHADQTTDEVFEVFSVNSAGGTPVKLNGALVASGDTQSTDLQFSPNGSRVIYLADQTTDEVFEIFSVPSGGGSAIKLNDTLVASGDVTAQRISPDSSRVLYLADQSTDEVFEIFSVPATGGTPVKLSGAMGAGGDVSTAGLQFSPNGNHVVYFADQNADNVNELFSVPSAGGTAVKLNATLVTNGDVGSNGILISPDSSRVVYTADQDADNVFEIFSVPIAGGTPVKLNGSMVANGDVAVAPAGRAISPDGSRVVYVADQDTDEVLEVFSVPIAGGTPVKLNGPMATGGDVQTNGLSFSPNGSRLLYAADQETDGLAELFMVPVAGGTPVRINGPMAIGGGVATSGGQFTPDGNRVVYVAQQDTAGTAELYSRIIRLHSTTGGSWDTPGNWDFGVAPDEVMEVILDASVNTTATGNSIVRDVFELRVGGGVGTSTLTLDDGALINALNGLTIASGGVIRGDGQIVGSTDTINEGELRAGTGDRLELFVPNLSNNNTIEVIGSTENLAEIEFSGNVFNRDDVGLITGQNALMRFQGGLANEGALAIGFGASSIIGDIENNGEIVVSGGGNATFYDDVIQNKDLVVSQVGVTTSVAVFFGAFTGSGGSSGGGDIFFEGDLQPGNSPASVTFENNVSLGNSATTEIEIAGLSAGTEHDQIEVIGDLVLNGDLNVTLLDGFSPELGDSFDILNWSSLTGTFDTINLPLLGSGLSWNLSQLYTAGILEIGLGGDFDHDGDIDGRDFLIWQRGGSPIALSATDLVDWQANYGAGQLTAESVAVPEPGSLMLVTIMGMVGVYRRSTAG
jgi:Tol biopolymer transport system component